MSLSRTSILLPAALSLVSLAPAQRLFVCESTNDTVMEFSPVDGQLVAAVAMDLAALTGGAIATPIEILEAQNGELWVSDQTGDGIFRFSGDGTMFLGQTATGMDNVRGFALRGAGGVASNAGTQNGAPGNALVEFDASGTPGAATPIGSPFDLEPYTRNGVAGYLVSDINNEDIVFVEGANLANQTVFHDSDGVTGIDFPEQVKVTPGGRIFAAGFSSPSGIYEYDAMGNEVAYIDTSAIGALSGLRGVHLLLNGNIMFTNGGGVHVYDTTTMTISTVMSGVSGRFISELGGSSCACSNFCMANPNSTGATGAMSATGSSIIANNDVTLTASNLPQNAFGFFITSQAQGFVPNPAGSAGNLCLAGAIGRYVGAGQIQNSGMAGAFSLAIDLTQTPQPMGTVSIGSGQTWNFQAWHRDSVGGMATSNFTDGLSAQFQ